jgi:hypothetical protein
MAKRRDDLGLAADALARSLAAAARGGTSEPAAAPGMAPESVRDHFARALDVLRGGGDPRKVAELPALFQEAFVRIWEKARETDPLLDLARLSKDAGVQKSLRRVLHRLRSAGVDLADQPGSRPSILQRVAAEEERPVPCFLTETSAEGSESVIIARYVRGGVAVAQAILSDEVGLVEFEGSVVGRSRYREIRRTMEHEEEGRWLEIPYAEARQRLDRGADRSREKGRALPEKYIELSVHFPKVEPALLPSAREMFPRDSLAPDLLEKSASLLDRIEFGLWRPAQTFMNAMVEKLEEIRQSQVIISDEQRIEQVRRLLETAADRMLEGAEERRRFQERLFAMAVYLERQGRSDAARQAAAAAWPLSDADFQPSTHPFFSRLARLGFLPPEEIVEHMKSDAPDMQSEGEGVGAEPEEEQAAKNPKGRIILP